jgi:alpha-1,2-mannosyltransferase
VPVYERSLANGGHYTYPPITFLVFGPLSHLRLGSAHAIMIAVGVVALAAVVWLTMRMVGVRPGVGMVGAALAVTGAGLWIQPVHDSLDQGQVNILLMLLVITDFALSNKRGHGALIGIAMAIKLTPAIFVVYLLLIRRTRAAITAVVVAVGLTGLGFLIAPGDSVRYWLHGLFMNTAYVMAPIKSPADVSNQSINGAVTRLVGQHTIISLVVALAVAVAGLIVAVRAHRRGAEVAGILATAITGLLVSPLSWHEHWVWIVPVIVWATAVAIRLSATAPILAPALPVAITFPFLMWPLASQPGRLGAASILAPAGNLWRHGHHNVFVAVVGSAYVGAGLLMLAGGWVALNMTKGAATGASPTLPTTARHRLAGSLSGASMAPTSPRS